MNCRAYAGLQATHALPTSCQQCRVPRGGTKQAVSAIFRLARCGATLKESGNPGWYRTIDRVRLRAPPFAVPKARRGPEAAG